jgi:cation transport ATPase
MIMKKRYKIDVDCANCANKMEVEAKKTEGVKDAVVNFMTLKMIVDFEDGADPKEVMPRVLENCKKVESDCQIFF